MFPEALLCYAEYDFLDVGKHSQTFNKVFPAWQQNDMPPPSMAV